MGRQSNQATFASVERHRRHRGIAVAVGVIACAAVVWQSSHATFSATTSSSGNRIGAGTVTIDVNNGGAAMFSTVGGDTALAPGASRSVCIGVGYTGTLAPTSVALYFPNGATQAKEMDAGSGTWNAWQSAVAGGAEMDDNVTLQVEVNNADLATDPGSVCTGTFGDVIAAGTNLRTLISTKSAWGATTSYTVPTMGNGKYRSYRFTYTLGAGAGNNVQGDGVEFTAMWEAQR
ncbi:hypothetical protein ACWT_3734 [Actinoplanes sp. SE50]|uniref:hypothetical protein n=1 Tax=unclassified Actinoplanes TaxID=2626549 RepID=UPI00023EC983|nr:MULTISPECIES: hypothetical protein [unclassified Actinoplanes]AEV84757.1 hypothetical protein ACPL_3862 [Actinoplanes sp. SE50/110]ATO83149.1 hypothetical protein ACWT_3734 [Actinoplanes sp. SE50]SLM00556.1 hypothetical protein ACSP50_3789 [Actinoplanes sp. SE50/110]